jgi:hypothetical protein
MAGPLGSGQFRHFFQWNIDPKFFAKFAGGALIILFAGIDMPGCARVPSQWMSIFPSGAHLEEDLSGGGENQDVDGPVEQVIRMHFAPRGRPLQSVFFVHHREPLFGCIIADFRGDRSNPIR